MKSFIALSALVLAVCVVSSQGKSFGNKNVNKNVNDNSNGDFDFLSSFLDSMLSQERKGKAALASRAFPVAAAQQAVQQDAEIVETAAADNGDASASAPQQDEISAIPRAQMKFFQTLMAAEAEEFLQ